jgi:hypothetical protein
MSRDKVKKVDYSKLGQEPIGRRWKRSQENRMDQKKSKIQLEEGGNYQRKRIVCRKNIMD